MVLKLPASMLATRLGTANSRDTPAKSQKLRRYIRKVSSSSSDTWRGRSLDANGAEADTAGVPGDPTLERDGAVLAARAPDLLALERVERRDQLRPRLLGLDDVVDVAALGGEVGVGEFLDVIVDQLLGLDGGIGG